MSNHYLLFKSLHILGVTLFLGNIMVTAWWKNMADRTQHPAVIAYAQRQVTLTDWLFTLPGVILVALAGGQMAYQSMQGATTVKWLVWGQGLFIASGIIWFTVLIPTQIKQAKLAREFHVTQVIPDHYWRLCKRWNVFGAIAVLLPLLNLYWMVFKPI